MPNGVPLGNALLPYQWLGNIVIQMSGYVFMATEFIVGNQKILS